MNKTITIYDYANHSKTITVEHTENVSFYHIHILSGDETVTVYYKDGKTVNYDACREDDKRFTGYDDGEYDVDVTKINKWDNYSSKIIDLLADYERISYKRYDEFCNEVCKIR